MKRIFLFLLLTLLVTIAQTETSNYTIPLRTTSGNAVTTGNVELLPYGNTYPTGALALTHTGSGVWTRTGIKTGEYSLYYNGSLISRYDRFWIGENKLTLISEMLEAKPLQHLSIKSGAKFILGNNATDSLRAIYFNTGDSLIVYNRSEAKKDTIVSRNWIRKQNFGTGSGDLSLYAKFLNPEHFLFSGLNNDSVSINIGGLQPDTTQQGDTLFSRFKYLRDTPNFYPSFNFGLVVHNNRIEYNSSIGYDNIILNDATSKSGAIAPFANQIYVLSNRLFYHSEAGQIGEIKTKLSNAETQGSATQPADYIFNIDNYKENYFITPASANVTYRFISNNSKTQNGDKITFVNLSADYTITFHINTNPTGSENIIYANNIILGYLDSITFVKFNSGWYPVASFNNNL
jgi:hypothetical protein